jgi:transcriptional regulator with XRE-family HTH domain
MTPMDTNINLKTEKTLMTQHPGMTTPTPNEQPLQQAMASSFYEQLITRPTEAANDTAPPEVEADSTRTGLASTTVPGHLSRDRALTFNIIGPRLIAARELNGIPQQEAARNAGMGNSTQLSLWEQGRRAPPLYALLTAAKTLNVSMDFIFGLSDDPERDARAARRNACIRAVHQMLTTTAETIASGLEASDALAGPDASNFRELMDAASALTSAVEQLHRLNVEVFEGLPGGATVLAAVERMERVQLKGRDVLSRHDNFAECMRLQIAAIGPLRQGDTG